VARLTISSNSVSDVGFTVMFSCSIISSTPLVSLGAIRVDRRDFAVAGVILLARRWNVSDEWVVGVKGLRDRGRLWVVSIPPSSGISLGVGWVLDLWGIKGEAEAVPISHNFSDFPAFLLFCCCCGP